MKKGRAMDYSEENEKKWKEKTRKKQELEALHASRHIHDWYREMRQWMRNNKKKG